MRYKLTIEYEGTSYCGFQKQKNIAKKSIEGSLEKAIFKLSQENTKIIASGRTDAGVHAKGQVIHFDLEKEFKPHTIIMALNHHLHNEKIAIIDCEIVDDNFHARYNAKSRHYSYVILNRPAKAILDSNRAWQIGGELNIDQMRESAEVLVGTHDFTSFRDRHCQSKSPIKTIEAISIRKIEDKIIIDISAKSFLHHMVRNIVGTITWIALNRITNYKMIEILNKKDRKLAGINAPAHGLYFIKVDY